jgi:capsule assembly protein Wzi
MPAQALRTSIRLLFAFVTTTFIIGLLPLAAGAQSSSTVDPSDPVYRAIDRFIADGLIDTVIVGQRPYSRREITRLVAEAVRNRGRLELGFGDTTVGPSARSILAGRLQYTNALLDEMRAAYPLDTSRHGVPGIPIGGRLDRWDAEGTVLASPWRRVPNGGIGGIQALINPLGEYRQGREYVDGITGAFDASAHGDFGRFASLNVAGEGRMLGARGDATFRGRANVLSLSTRLRNFRLDVGRDYVQWGPTPRGGLSVSMNAPPLDLVRLQSDAPFVLPWVFRLAGPVRAELFMADLGIHREFPHAKLVGWKLSALPWRRVELGITVLDETGGEGGPPASFVDRLTDVFPFIDALFRNKSDFQFSNKLAGGDIRLRIPEARGLELYGESLLDDFDLRRVKSSLWEDNGLIAGFTLPRLTMNGAFRLDGELHHTGVRYYQHAQFISGVTLHSRIIGDDLGPRGDGGYATLTWAPSIVQELALNAAVERRSNDQYRIVSNAPNDANFHFERVEVLPKEIRQRLTVTWSDGSITKGLRLVGEAGVERVEHFNVVAGSPKTNGLARLTIEYRP